MFGAIMGKMAALAQGGEIAWAVIARVVIEMRAGQYDARGRQHRLAGEFGQAQLARQAIGGGQATHPLSPIVAPASSLLIIPAPVTQMVYPHSMRPATMVTPPLCPREANKVRQFAPVDWIKPAMVRTDRHGRSFESFAKGTEGESSEVAIVRNAPCSAVRAAKPGAASAWQKTIHSAA